MENKRIYNTYLSYSTNAGDLLEEFDSQNEDGSWRYDTMVITSMFYLHWNTIHDNKVSIIIKRLPACVDYIDSGLTFAQFRKLSQRFLLSREKTENVLLQTLNAKLAEVANTPACSEPVIEVTFDKPLLFHMRSSVKSREKTVFAFTGAVIKR